MKNPNVITKYYQKEDINSKAVYSSCEKYRYSLTRIWNKKAEKLHFVMLNPSTATEIQNDPTVERCERRARTLNFGSFRVTNIFAWRDTDPKKMKLAKDPVGLQNNKAIIDNETSSKDKFFLATNDYLLSGGDNMFFLEKNSNVYHLGYPLRDAFIDYIINQEKIESKVDNRFIRNE